MVGRKVLLWRLVEAFVYEQTGVLLLRRMGSCHVAQVVEWQMVVFLLLERIRREIVDAVLLAPAGGVGVRPAGAAVVF